MIEAPQYYIIELTFNHFDIENGYDSVEIFDGSQPSASKSLHKYSGNIIPGPIVSSGNKLSVVLLSDELYSGAGFKAHYKTSKLDFTYSD